MYIYYIYQHVRSTHCLFRPLERARLILGRPSGGDPRLNSRCCHRYRGAFARHAVWNGVCSVCSNSHATQRIHNNTCPNVYTHTNNRVHTEPE